MMRSMMELAIPKNLLFVIYAEAMCLEITRFGLVSFVTQAELVDDVGLEANTKA